MNTVNNSSSEYQNSSNSFAIFALVILVMGLVLGFLIYTNNSNSIVAQQPANNLPKNNMPKNNNLQNEEPKNMPNNIKSYAAAPELQIDANKTYVALIKTNKGDIKISLDTKQTPNTANNFIFLANQGFYNNTVFHRIISGFMIQGGDPLGNGTGGPGYTFNDEPFTAEYTKGTIAMANRGPNTNGSQFFIMHADYPLPKNYTVFGKALDEESLKVVDAIGNTPVVEHPLTGEESKPVTNVVIESIQIQEN